MPAITGPLRAVEYAGFALWGAGFLMEAIADRQKDVAKRENPKEFVKSGLWGISRHPNVSLIPCIA
jgi:steroid 5-alpha reductase family enzyme